LTFPAIDIVYYTSIANVIQIGSQSLNGGTLTFTVPDEVIVINGDWNISGGLTVSGTGTVVVNGKGTVSDSVQYAGASDKLPVLATNGISFATENSAHDGFYYTHNLSNTATFDITFGVMVNGGVVADVLNVDHPNVTILHDPAMNMTLGHQLHIPGY